MMVEGAIPTKKDSAMTSRFWVSFRDTKWDAEKWRRRGGALLGPKLRENPGDKEKN